MKILVLALSILTMLSCVRGHSERDIYSGLPTGTNNIIILRQEHQVEGSCDINRSVDGKFNRTTTVTDDVLIEIDTLEVGDVLTIERKVSGKVTTDLHVAAYFGNDLYENHYVRSELTDYENIRIYHLE
jgi:hypothetical protein